MNVQMEVPMQTILITGTSSGYGLETARHFLANGWNVIAAMRTPNLGVLPRSESPADPAAGRHER